MMVGIYVSIATFLMCYICRTDTKDIQDDLGLKPSQYSVVIPEEIHRWTRGINTHSVDKDGEGTISYALNFNNRELILHLRKNRDFLHPNFVQRLHYTTSYHNSSYHKIQVHCYYHGEVEGYDNSVVALSTCSGLRGVIVLENETYGLEPVQGSNTKEHLLYLLKDVQSDPVTCGVMGEADSSTHFEPFEPGHSLTSMLRIKRNLPQTKYVELVLVVDHLRYTFKNENETAVLEEMVEMANLLDGYYKPLNIRIVLVGVEIFKDGNPFSVEGPAGQVLGMFVKWRKNSLLPKIRNDMSQMLIGREYLEGTVLGMAFVSTVCSEATSGGINAFSKKTLPFTSMVVAHEMGHNLGMKHDRTGCQCGGGSCIMSATAGGSPTFSRCSAEDFEILVMNGGGECLKNQPSVTDFIGTPECGNGRLEEGEQCDCGKPEECDNKCCDPNTCMFTRGSACAQGDCCHNCQVEVSGTPCRKSVNTCDLPEYCDGITGSCPEDFYIMDGLTCHDAYCYEGRCQTYDYQCHHLFAPDPATKADDICFQHANTKGNLFGNCGRNGRGDYLSCSVANAMCGKVQCTNVNLNTIPSGAQISGQIIAGSTCVNADFNLGTDVLDPAYVNPGSPCAKGKTCIDFQCVNASVLLPGLDCDAEVTCHGRGVCNNLGHCHCENSWGPPSCDIAGRGGSIDSGPAQIDHSVRNGLLIFFLLVVPVLVFLILGLLYIFKRDSLDPCLKSNLNLASRFNITGKQNGKPDSNVQTQHSAEAPPEVPEYLPNTSAPTSGYGEIDYWDSQPSGHAPRPPAPVQGPGVPKPFPTKQPTN